MPKFGHCLILSKIKAHISTQIHNQHYLYATTLENEIVQTLPTIHKLL